MKTPKENTQAVSSMPCLTTVLFLFFILGMWYSILEFLNVAGVVTNSFLVAFTSSYGRSWEGDPSTSNRTELLFNATANRTETVFIVTEHIAGPSRLWLIIGFEVSRLFVNLFWKVEGLRIGPSDLP